MDYIQSSGWPVTGVLADGYDEMFHVNNSWIFEQVFMFPKDKPIYEYMYM